MSTDFRPEIKTKGQLKKLVFEKATKNHIWINAFSLVNPTDETLLAIGKEIHAMLNDPDNLLPSYTGGKSDEPIHTLSRLTPCLYLYINKS